MKTSDTVGDGNYTQPRQDGQDKGFPACVRTVGEIGDAVLAFGYGSKGILGLEKDQFFQEFTLSFLGESPMPLHPFIQQIDRIEPWLMLLLCLGYALKLIPKLIQCLSWGLRKIRSIFSWFGQKIGLWTQHKMKEKVGPYSE